MSSKIIIHLLKVCLAVTAVSCFFVTSPAALAQSSLGGVGAQLVQTNGFILVNGTVPGSPANRAGIPAGSKIMSIDGTPTTTVTLDEALKLIRGAEGTVVKMGVILPDGSARDYSLTRINIGALMDGGPAIHYQLLDDRTGLLALPGFGTNTTPKTVAAALDSLRTREARDIVIDVRGNQGGSSLNIANVASLFVGKETILWEFRAEGKPNIRPVFGTHDKIWTGEIIVLVNSNTCSGGELFASALQTSGRAKIWGENTPGKATIYNLITEPEGGKKRVPAGEFLTSNGEPLQGRGVTPDFSQNCPDNEIFSNACKFFSTQNN